MSKRWLSIVFFLISSSALALDDLSPESLAPVFELFRADPESSALLDSVLSKLGATDPHEISKILVLGSSHNHLLMSERGHYQPGAIKTYEVPYDVTGKLQWADEEITARSTQAFRTGQDELGYAKRLTFKDAPEICVVSGMSLLDTFQVFVHEFSHFLGDESVAFLDPLEFGSLEAYIQHMLYGPGGEIPARVAQMRALAKTDGKGHTKTVQDHFFNSDGELIDRSGLENHVLDDLKYRIKMTKGFKESVAYTVTSTSNQLNRLRFEWKPSLELYRESLESYIQQLQGPRRYIDAEKNIASTREKLTVLNAQIEAIERDIAKEQVRFTTLEEKFPDIFEAQRLRLDPSGMIVQDL